MATEKVYHVGYSSYVVYRLKGIPDLYADRDGNFFYKGSPAKKVYNNGSTSLTNHGTISVLCGKSKRGLIKLIPLDLLFFYIYENYIILSYGIKKAGL